MNKMFIFHNIHYAKFMWGAFDAHLWYPAILEAGLEDWNLSDDNVWDEL